MGLCFYRIKIFEETIFDFGTLKHRFREIAFLTKGLRIIAKR